MRAGDHAPILDRQLAAHEQLSAALTSERCFMHSSASFM
jgi:hypothetical protein